MLYSVELLLGLSVCMSIFLETYITTLEMKIGNKMLIYVSSILMNEFMVVIIFYLSNNLAIKETLKFKSECLIKYNSLDNMSKEKDTIESFKNKLEKSASVIQTKYSWGLSQITSMFSCFSSLFIIFTLNNDYTLLSLFIVMNIVWMKYSILYCIEYLDKERKSERKTRHIIQEKISLFMNRFHLNECSYDTIINQDIEIFNGGLKLNFIWIIIYL
jgi:hypothetical protein